MSTDFRNRFIRHLVGYTPGEQPSESGWIKLNTNEHPWAPSPKVASELVTIANDISHLRRYPSPLGEPLRSSLATHFNLPVEKVLVTNGSDEALALFCRSFLEEGDIALCPELTYSLYPVLVATVGATLQQIPMTPKDKNPFAIDLERLTTTPGKVVFLPNPNAPTGEFIDLKTLSAAIAANPNKLWILDEAYNDFVEKKPSSAATLLKHHQNLIVCRTFSKSHSLAGLRVGYVLSDNSQLMSTLYALKDSYNEDTIALRLANVAFKDDTYTQAATNFIIQERKFLTEKLENQDFTVIPSQANFILVCHKKISAEKLYLKLKEHKILVRYFAHSLVNQYIRISIGTHEENLILLQKLTDILKTECQAAISF